VTSSTVSSSSLLKKTEKNLSNAFYKEKPILFFSTKNNGVNDEATETDFLSATFLL
jgi:hypothetical protein